MANWDDLFGGSGGGLSPPTSIPVTPDQLVTSATATTVPLAMSTDSFSSSSASLVEALDISGSGVLEFLSLINFNGVIVDPSQMVVTIDGVEVYNSSSTMGADEIRVAVGVFGKPGSQLQAGGLGQIIFNSTLNIRIAGDGVDSVTCDFRYYLT